MKKDDLLQKGGQIDHALKEKIWKIMRLTGLFLLISFVAISAGTYSQNTRFSFKMENSTLNDLFLYLEQNSGYRFAYNKSDLDDAQKITCEFNNESINQILEKVLDTKRLSVSIKNEYIIITSKENATRISTAVNQPVKTVSGRVTDSSGAPLPGVSVVIKGTTKGVITDTNGSYSIDNVPANAILVFSFVGMKMQEVKIEGKTSINVALTEETVGIEEVVAIGYGTRTRKEVTGSVAHTTGEDLKISPTANVSGSLAGRMAGVVVNQRNGEPGRDDATIRIRGISTMGDSDPLYVIDGVANSDGISRLDPEDIESISVLKDASAAIYGARAAAGVILVTTKRGKEGKPEISYNINQGFVSPTRLPRMADAPTYARALRELQLNKGMNESDLTYTLEDVQKFKDGSSPLTHPNTNWFKDLFKDNSMQSRHNLTVRGGNNRIKYFFSLGTLEQDGLYKEGETKYKQYNFRSNIDAQITENLKVGFDLAGRKENRQWPGYDQWWIFWMAMRQAPTEFDIYPNGSYSLGLAGLNPLAMVRESGYQRLKRDVFNGTLSFEYKIPQIKGLSIDGFAAVDNVSNFNKNFTTPWDYSTFDPVSNTYQTFQTPYQSIVSLSESFQRNTSLTLNFRLKYAKKIGLHGIDAFIAYEQNTDEGDNLSAYRNIFDTEKIDQLFAGSTDKQNQGNDGSGYKTARQNYFGRASYNFADKYLVDFNFRYDGSMNFPKDSRFGFFPGISAGWRISQESFFNVPFINDLKLRASYGELGNDRIGSFLYMQKFGFGNNYVLNGSDTPGIQETGVSVPDVTWETTIVSNLGLDITFFKGKLNAAIDVFKNKTTGMLISRNLAIPSLAGFSAPPENSGEMENKGLELMLDYKNKFGAIGFSANGNISYSKNKVLFIDEKINSLAPWQAQTGYKLNRRLLYDCIGIYRTQADLDKYPSLPGANLGDLIYRDVNGDKVINSLDQVPYETNEIPEIVFGLNLGLTYHNFDLTAFFQGQANANQPVGYRFDGTGNVLQRDLEDTWTSANINATHPRAGIPNNYYCYIPSTFWIQNASFVRLKTLELGYNFSKQRLRKVGIDGLRVYVSGSNLFTISQIKDQDPEITSNEGTAHPQTKVFNIGLKVTL